MEPSLPCHIRGMREAVCFLWKTYHQGRPGGFSPLDFRQVGGWAVSTQNSLSLPRGGKRAHSQAWADLKSTPASLHRVIQVQSDLLDFEDAPATVFYLCRFSKSHNLAVPRFTHLLTSPCTGPDEFSLSPKWPHSHQQL